MDQEILEQIKKEIAANKIVVFTKGTKEAPMCGFSARAISVFKELGRPFKTIDILPDPRIRQTLSAYSNWPTVPQVFINGKFIGGCDIVAEMHQKGELQPIVEAAFKSQA
jgi:monothiol glutaredoxin